MTIWNNDLLPTTRWAKRALAPLNDMEEMFDRFRRDFYAPDLFQSELEGFAPKVEVKETDKHIHVAAEIPGMKEKDINVTLRDNCLVIEGEKKNERKKEEKGFFSSEFSYGSFYRSIPLSADVDQDKVEATYKNGLLDVTLNKLEENKQTAKRIEIKH